jgi:hypothetical protein
MLALTGLKIIETIAGEGGGIEDESVVVVTISITTPVIIFAAPVVAAAPIRAVDHWRPTRSPVAVSGAGVVVIIVTARRVVRGGDVKSARV